MKLLLFLLLISISLVWTLTSPKNFFDFVRRLYQPKNWIILGFQFLPFLQLGNVLVFSWPENQFAYMWEIIGIIICTIGVLFASWAKIVMKANWGRPGQHDIFVQKNLVTHGPFGITRNPIYLGLFLAFLGFEIAMQSYFVLLSLLLYLLMHWTIIREERLLSHHFGKSYQVYKSRIPRFFPYS